MVEASHAVVSDGHTSHSVSDIRESGPVPMILRSAPEVNWFARLRRVLTRHITQPSKYLEDPTRKEIEQKALSKLLEYFTDQDLRELPMLVIGGWAVWAYTRGRRSSDIDMVMDPAAWGLLEMREKERGNFSSQNTSKGWLKRQIKIRVNESRFLDLDVYVAHQDKLQISPEELLAHFSNKFTVKYLGKNYQMHVPTTEALIALKIASYADTEREKDALDIFALLQHNRRSEADLRLVGRILQRYGLINYTNVNGENRDLVERFNAAMARVAAGAVHNVPTELSEYIKRSTEQLVEGTEMEKRQATNLDCLIRHQENKSE